MREHITDSERMTAFIYAISELHEPMSMSQKKEMLKLFGNLGEIFGENLLPFTSKIYGIFQKKFKDLDPQLNQAISDSFGTMVHFLLKNISGKSEGKDQLKIIISMCHHSIVQPVKQQQMAASMIQKSVVQQAPKEAVEAILQKLAVRLGEQISYSQCKCKPVVLQSIMATLFQVESALEQYCPLYLPALIECIKNKDLSIRKMAIDTVFAFSQMLPKAIAQYKDQFTEALGESRYDKNKPIRDSTADALNGLRELPPAKQSRVAETGEKKGAKSDPTPRPVEMPQEKFDIQAEAAQDTSQP